MNRNLSKTLPPPAPKPANQPKNILGQFKDMTFEDKVSNFRQLKDLMTEAIKNESSIVDERGMQIKKAWEELLAPR